MALFACFLDVIPNRGCLSRFKRNAGVFLLNTRTLTPKYSLMIIIIIIIIMMTMTMTILIMIIILIMITINVLYLETNRKV